jgi:hypothetical protein
MNLRLKIAPETERRLRARAAETGQTPEAFVEGLLELTLSADVLPPPGTSKATGNETTGPSEPLTDSGEEQDPLATWRGVFATEHPHETLFMQDFAVPATGLPRREPKVILNPRWLDDEL